MKKIIISSVILTLSLLPITSFAAKYTFKLGDVTNKEHIWHKASVYFADLVNKNSHGQIEIKIYPNSELGSEMDVINGIQLGTVDMTITGESLQNWAPLAALLAVPYAIKDSAQLARIVNGKVGDTIKAQIEEKAKLVPLAWFERLPRQLTSNRPIKTPDDLKGLVMRVPSVPLFVKFWSALGAKPTPLAFNEVFTALQQHTIEAQENPLDLIMSASFFEVQKYVNLTNHTHQWIYVVIGKKQFDKLPTDLQQVMIDAGKKTTEYQNNLVQQTASVLKEELVKKGMIFNDVDIDAFKAKSAEAVKKALTPEQLTLFKEMQKM